MAIPKGRSARHLAIPETAHPEITSFAGVTRPVVESTCKLPGYVSALTGEPLVSSCTRRSVGVVKGVATGD
jgi:hypothetical protein